MDIQIDFVDEKRFAIVRLDGKLNLSNVGSVGAALIRQIDTDFDGNVIMDLSNLKDELLNDDISALDENRVIRARFPLRKPFAVVVGDTEAAHSRLFMKNLLERQGIHLQHFLTIQDAKEWLLSLND